MNTQALLTRKRKGYITLTKLLMFAFASAFFSAVLTLLKFPSTVNLLHFVIVPSICIFTLTKTRVKGQKQILITKEILFAIFCFFTVNVASAFLNNAGVVNAILNFLFFSEHFLLLLAIISIPMTPERWERFRAYIMFASFTNTIFAYIQRYVFNMQRLPGLEDNIKGVFIGQGAGHVVGASVALSFGMYYFTVAKHLPIWIRVAVVLATFWHMNMADAKQTLLIFGVSAVLLLLTKLKNIGQALKYLIAIVVLGYAFLWCMENVPAFHAFNTWVRPEIYGSDGEATKLKMATFRIVPTFYTSPLNSWLGLGPGHTVGRLGGWMLDKYQDLLSPLGATVHPASKAVWTAVAKSWIGDQSSMFSPLFGWAAIWGDLGFLGLASFIYIWSIVWRKVCIDDTSRFFILNIFVFGLVFSQMEEPGYMLYITCLIAIQWHERELKKQIPGYAEKIRLPRPKSIKGWVKRLLLLTGNYKHIANY